MSLVVVVVGLVAGAVFLARIRTPAPPGVDVSDVGVVVPARDEAATVGTLVASVGDEPVDAVVVDDGSTDDTAGVAERAGARVVRASDPPAGWAGKPWACATGAAAIARPTLVFLDADTWVVPGGLTRIVAEQHRRGGLVSVQPFHVTERPYESLSTVFNVVSMMAVAAFTVRDRVADAAFGPCLVCRRSDYEAAGGHEAVRSEVVEDVALARRFRAAGLPVWCLGGRGSIEFRMYPGGLRQLVEGWTKNFATGARLARPGPAAASAIWVAAGLTAAIGLARSPSFLTVGAYGAFAVELWWMLRRIGRFAWWTAPLFPVPLVFFVVVFCRSLFVTYGRGSVTWRGRRVPTR